ncbi:MAG: delta-60 repeat domain-containing protein [Devosia sp.]
MRLATLLTTTFLIAAGPAVAGDIVPVVNFSTDLANDLRGLSFAADGKIYVSGHVGAKPEETKVVVARFNADGTIDKSFSDDGWVTLDLAPGRQEASQAVVELANGDILVSTNVVDEDKGHSAYLLRFDSTGKQIVAPAWGDAEGKFEVVFGWKNADNAAYPDTEKKPLDAIWNMKIDKSSGEEKLVLAGFGSATNGTGRKDNDRYVARLNPADGSNDPGFNGGAPFTYHSLAEFPDGGRNALVEADGSILSAGYTNFGDGYGNHVILIRLLPDGTLDKSFGNFVVPAVTTETLGLKPQPGVAVFNPFQIDGGVSEGYGVAKLADGSYVTTGYGEATAEGKPSTLGYKSSLGPDLVSFKVLGDKLDPTYGNNGTLALQSEGAGQPTNEERGRNIVGLADGRTLHVGRYGGNAAVYVLTAAGQLDDAVGEHGIIKLGHPSVDGQLFSAALSSDGKHIAATTSNSPGGARLIVLEVK